MQLARRDVRRGFLDKVVREKHALAARMRSAPPFARHRYVPAVSAAARLATTGRGVFAAVRRPDPIELIGSISDLSDVGGAVFVATDAPFYGGSLDLLARVRDAAGNNDARRPAVVQLDFIVDAVQIARAAAHGADATVVQPWLVTRDVLDEMVAAAKSCGLELLADVSTQADADTARDAGIATVLVPAFDWDMLRAAPLAEIDAPSRVAFDVDDAIEAAPGFVARVVRRRLEGPLAG